MSAAAATPSHDLRRVIEFNFFPISEMNESWWQSDWLAVPLFRQLTETKAAWPKLSDFLLESYQLKGEIYYDFATREKQAALLSSTDLKALIYLMGLIVESDTIANAIEKETQRAIRQSLGEADYIYALKNKVSMCRPQTGYRTTVDDKEEHHFTDFKNRVYQSGLRCLLNLLGDVPQSFIQRILFKLPKAWSALSLANNKDDYHEIRTCLPHLFKELKVL